MSKIKELIAYLEDKIDYKWSEHTPNYNHEKIIKEIKRLFPNE